MSFSHLLFDLDGTLTDSGPGIMHAAAYALRQFGIEETDPQRLRRFIGPPLSDAFPALYGFSYEDTQEAIRQFRLYYRPKGIYENKPYPGIAHCLQALKDRGKGLAVATSKPQEMAERVLKRFDLWQYFDVVCGASLDERHNRKDLIVDDAMRWMRVRERSQALMVGDREQDVWGAQENGIACAGVLWGYGSREELQQAGATYIVSRWEELLDIAGD